MRRVMYAIVCGLLLAMLGHDAGAQSMSIPPATANLRWNEYLTVERFSADKLPFHSIIGESNTNLVSGSNGLSYTSPTIAIGTPLFGGFHFSVMGHDFQNGAKVEVSPAGFFKFVEPDFAPPDNDAIYPPQSASYFLAPGYGGLDHLIMPFWGDLNTQNSYDGIWYNYSATDPATLKIEWNVHAPDLSLLRFQAWVILKKVNTSPVRYYATIEFHYDNSSAQQIWQQPTDGTTYKRGAAVGLKNWGQYDGDPHYIGPYMDLVGLGNTPGTGTGKDDRNTLMIPPVSPGSDEAFTRVPMHNSGSLPEWYACTPLQDIPAESASTIFHYALPQLPTGGYRVKPVDNDILTISTGTALRGRFDSIVPTYTQGDARAMAAVFNNRGTDSVFNVPVTVEVRRNLTLIKTSSSTIASLAPGASVTITFPDSINTVADSLIPGSYTMRAHHSLFNDQNRTNDTASSDFTIRDTIDVAPVEIQSPILTASPTFTRIPLDVPMPITVTFGNFGNNAATNIHVGYQIRNGGGEVIATATDSIPGTISPGTTTIRNLPSWTPTTAGYYYIEVFTAAAGDHIRRNDTILSRPNNRFIWWGTSDADRWAQHIPLVALPAIDIGVEDPATAPHSPSTGSTVSGSFGPAVLIRNYGISAAAGGAVNLTIRNSANTIVNSQNSFVPSIASGGVIEKLFNSVSLAPGNYCATVATTLSGDGDPGNNIRTWCFTVTGGSAAPDIENDRSNLSVHPNPATTEAWIDFRLPHAGAVHCSLFDIYGNSIKTWNEGYDGGDGTLRVDLAGLASGLYAVRMETADGARRIGWIVVRK